MHSIRSTALVLFLLVAAIQGESFAPSSNNLKDRIRYLLEILGTENEYVRFLSYMKIHPPENNAEMKSLYYEFFSRGSYLADLAQIYAKHFTLDDVNKLIQFYTSPLGKKTLRMNQELNKHMEDLMLTKISDYIFTAMEHGLEIVVPEINK